MGLKEWLFDRGETLCLGVLVAKKATSTIVPDK